LYLLTLGIFTTKGTFKKECNVMFAAVDGCACCSAVSFPCKIYSCCGTQYLPTASASISSTMSLWQCFSTLKTQVSHRLSLCSHRVYFIEFISCTGRQFLMHRESHPTKSLGCRCQYLVAQKLNHLELLRALPFFWTSYASFVLLIERVYLRHIEE